jgi:formylglycine-generating enzyme
LYSRTRGGDGSENDDVETAGALTMETVPVGDLGNAPDALNTNTVPGIGSVSYAYNIGTYEVFNSQYVEFLNSVATVGDVYGLYNANMASDAWRGGISRTGSGSLLDPYVYSSKANMGDKPVNWVSFYDAVRFVNWLENGQPTGTNQVAGTTETGSYTLFSSGGGTTNVSARAANATWVIPTENEWYKAAYYDPTASGTTNYWLYPTQSDSVPTMGLADATGNITNDGLSVANYNFGAQWNGQFGNVTTVGSAGASNYFGTFDQGGNVAEWNEAIIGAQADRGWRGGTFLSSEYNLRSLSRGENAPSVETYSIGFRVAMIPEPSCLAGVLVAAVGLCVRRGRKRSR